MALARPAIKTIEITPTLDTNAYGTGDQVGPGSTKLTKVCLGKPGHAILESLVITDKAKQSAALDILFFNSEPTVTSVDNAAYDVSDAELAAKAIGHVSVVAADYSILNVNSVATKRALELILAAKKNTANPEGDSLWVAIVSRGTPTYASDSLTLKFNFAN